MTKRGAVRVVHVCKVGGIAGAEGHLLRLLPGLAARGFDVHMLVLGSGEPTRRFREELAAGGVAVDRVPIRADTDPLATSTLWRRLRALRPDLVHTHLIHADLHGQAAAALAGVPARILSRHNNDPFRRRGLFLSLNRLVLRRVDRIVAISRSIARFVVEVEAADPRKVRTVPYGLDPSVVLPMARGAARTALGVGPTDPLVGVFGRAVPQKGIEVAIDAFPRVRAVHPAARLVVVGDGPLRPVLERRARRAGLGDGVVFTGWIERAADLMPACDVVVIPSRWEGFGLVALEAMASSRAIVASRVDALEEIVVDGETGLLVSPDDPGPLADAVTDLLGNPARAAALGAGGLARLRQEYSVAGMVDATIAVYAELLPSRPA